ncbi:MAG: hypothetical protein ACOVP2_04165 [Armatimonadaceae bacterium]
MFELSPDTKQVTGLPESKPDSFVAPRISVEQDDSVVLTMSLAELDALTDLVLNAPPTKLVDEEMAEHLLRRLMQLQREKIFTNLG